MKVLYSLEIINTNHRKLRCEYVHLLVLTQRGLLALQWLTAGKCLEIGSLVSLLLVSPIMSHG